MTETNESPGPDEREQPASPDDTGPTSGDDERTVGGSPADDLDPPDPANPTNTDDPG